jgi:hypothetical protein
MSVTAIGSFNVKLDPQTTTFGAPLNRLSLDKTFSGDLEATSKGEMLSIRTDIPGSAGYVAMETITATNLGGKKGSFSLMHFGVMNKGEKSLICDVVPDSGTDELKGITGKLSIDIKDGVHYYTFVYDVPAFH